MFAIYIVETIVLLIWALSQYCSVCVSAWGENKDCFNIYYSDNNLKSGPDCIQF